MVSRDLLLVGHIFLGVLLAGISLFILLNKDKAQTKLLSKIAVVISWIGLLPSGILYLTFYPATKTVILAGAWPWAHAVAMETKEHWGLLLPLFATMAAYLVLTGKEKESRKWWMLVLILTILIGVFGRVVKLGAGAS